MTFDKLEKIIEENHIPHNVTLMSDSGWECDATHMNGVFYSKDENTIVFTQSGDEYEGCSDQAWNLIWSDRFEKNINKNIYCSDEVRLLPLGFYSSIEDRFKEEIRKTGEFEDYYGIKESEDKYSKISLCKPLFFGIQIACKTGPALFKPIGYLGLNIFQDVCDLEIYIFQEYRGKGYGKIALKSLIDKLIKKELKVFNPKNLEEEIYEPRMITSSVRIENEASNALMIACGFKRKENVAAAFVSSINEDDDLEEMVQVIPYEIDLEES